MDSRDAVPVRAALGCPCRHSSGGQVTRLSGRVVQDIRTLDPARCSARARDLRSRGTPAEWRRISPTSLADRRANIPTEGGSPHD